MITMHLQLVGSLVKMKMPGVRKRGDMNILYDSVGKPYAMHVIWGHLKEPQLRQLTLMLENTKSKMIKVIYLPSQKSSQVKLSKSSIINNPLYGTISIMVFKAH